MSLIRAGNDRCCDLGDSGSLEYLVTNGIGGYASGTVSGQRTRRYHGLLVAALSPPLGRVVMATTLHESATWGGKSLDLATDQWHDGAVNPAGFSRLSEFHLEGRTPVWRWDIGNGHIERRIVMVEGQNTTAVVYRLVGGNSPVCIGLKVFAAYRDFHATTRSGDWKMDVTRTVNGVCVIAFPLARPLHVGSLEFRLEEAHTWYLGHLLSEERERGYPDHLDDDLLVATGTVKLEPGASATLVLSAEGDFPLEGNALLDVAARLDEALLESARRVAAAPLDGFSERLVLAAGQFIVRRDTEGARGTTVLAGYHWFSDWGRDTMISLPGLCLQTGRPAMAREILTTFARFIDRGMIPNRFPDSGGAPEYNTVDATLWFIEAIRAYVDATGDATLADELWPCLEEIIRWHESGTRYGIGVEHDDGLLRSGVPGVQLTWMDAKSGERVFTPRDGKCVEINALYHNAICALGWLAERVGHAPKQWVERAERVRRSFERFWNVETGFCFDVIDGPTGNDASLRPNQIFAVSLPESPLDLARQRAVVETCQKHLLTPFGLRTLAPWHPDYQGVYEGSPETRDGRYHQGTVWAWLLGPFALAHYRVNADAKAALSFLQPLSSHLSEHGMGSISEIFDGDPPHRPRGCIAQAWSVAETLRAWRILMTTHLPSPPLRSTERGRGERSPRPSLHESSDSRS